MCGDGWMGQCVCVCACECINLKVYIVRALMRACVCLREEGIANVHIHYHVIRCLSLFTSSKVLRKKGTGSYFTSFSLLIIHFSMKAIWCVETDFLHCPENVKNTS